MVLHDVPLFPLNTVLFPQMILPLQIFEPRYLAMISECLKQNLPFGVVLLQEGTAEEWRSSAESVPHKVGTLARITEVVKLEDGRMLITTVGTDRFRLLTFNHEKPYMTGDIEVWPDTENIQAPGELVELVGQVRIAFEAYLKMLMELAGKQIEGLEIPTDPAVLSYLVPNWLQVASPDKQRLLEVASSGERLHEENVILQRETEFLRRIKERADMEEAASGENQSDEPNMGQPNSYDISKRFSRN